MVNRNFVESVIKMRREGKDDSDIIAELTNEGLTPEQISSTLNQAKIKNAVSSKSPEPDMERYPVGEQASIESSDNMAPSIMQQRSQIQTPSPSGEVFYPTQSESYAPSEQFYDYASSGVDTEAIEEIAEEIIGEKWDEAKAKISSMVEWKNYADNRLSNIENKMKRIESLIDGLQTAILGKVQRYEQNIKDLGTEMKSIQGAFSKVLSPLSSNVKELQKLTGKLHSIKNPDKEKKK